MAGPVFGMDGLDGDSPVDRGTNPDRSMVHERFRCRSP